MKCVQEKRKNKKYEGKKKHRPFRNTQYFVTADEEIRKNITKKQINTFQCKNAQVTEEEWEFKENWLKN